MNVALKEVNAATRVQSSADCRLQGEQYVLRSATEVRTDIRARPTKVCIKTPPSKGLLVDAPTTRHAQRYVAGSPSRGVNGFRTTASGYSVLRTPSTQYQDTVHVPLQLKDGYGHADARKGTRTRGEVKQRQTKEPPGGTYTSQSVLS